MAALVIGTAFFLYNAKFVENVYLWVAITAVLVWVIILIASLALGGINPTFGEAGTALGRLGDSDSDRPRWRDTSLGG